MKLFPLSFLFLSLALAEDNFQERWCGTSTHSRNGKRQTGQCDYETVCDAPEMMLAYTNALSQKILPNAEINMHVYTFAEDDGSNPVATAQHTMEQQEFIDASYADAGISFNFQTFILNNSSARARTVVPYCDANDVLDRNFNMDCFVPETGWGSEPEACPASGECRQYVCETSEICDPQCTTVKAFSRPDLNCTCFCVPEIFQCDPASVGNGICDAPCNYFRNGWDGGDCCLSNRTLGSCRDPRSQNRDWWNEVDYQAVIATPNDDHSSFLVMKMSNASGLLGAAFFPFDDHIFGQYGGIMMNQMAWGNTGKFLGDTAVHEMGHALGLYHTHHGVTELVRPNNCQDACYEATPSLLTGDLIADTNPTPINYDCADPATCDADLPPGQTDLECETCTLKPWTNTPYRNFMGYADDACMDHFTPQQMGRMRCYIDLTYQAWLNDTLVPGTIVRPPMINSTCGINHVTWDAPLKIGSGELSYFIKREPGGEAIQVNGRIFDDATAVPGTNYTYQVRAATMHGQAMFASPIASVVTTGACSTSTSTSASDSVSKSSGMASQTSEQSSAAQLYLGLFSIVALFF